MNAKRLSYITRIILCVVYFALGFMIPVYIK